MKVAILAFDRFTDIDVFLPWDLLNRTKNYVSPWEVELVGSRTYHTSINGLTIPMTGHLSSLKTADAVLIASGPGVHTLAQNADSLRQLKAVLDPTRQKIGAMCSGAFLLASLGFLQDIPATTYSTCQKQLSEMGVQVVEKAFVASGNIATAAGCLAATDMVRWLITSLANAQAANQVLNEIQPNGYL